jgi:hypothetical protein
VEFAITTNACRGFCESFALPSAPFLTETHKPSQPVTSVGQCCNIMETEDVRQSRFVALKWLIVDFFIYFFTIQVSVRVLCLDGIRQLTFKSAVSCKCFHCKKD